MAELPNVPTMRELGLPSVEVMEWNGFFVPKDTPKPVQDILEKAIRKSIMAPEVSAPK